MQAEVLIEILTIIRDMSAWEPMITSRNHGISTMVSIQRPHIEATMEQRGSHIKSRNIEAVTRDLMSSSDFSRSTHDRRGT